MVRAGAFELHLCVGGIKQLEVVTGAGVAYVESKFAVSGVSYKVQSRETDPWGEEFTQARALLRVRHAARLPPAGDPRRPRPPAPGADLERLGAARLPQEWPVTPYTLRITNHTADMAYAKIYCDGFHACSQYISPGDNEVNGFKDSSGRRACSALHAARPRSTRQADGPLTSRGRSAGFREFLWSPPRRVNKAKGENPEPQFSDAEKARAAKGAAWASVAARSPAVNAGCAEGAARVYSRRDI